MAETADILIIGAGVAGLGAAYHLANDAKVIVLEACEAPCMQTSGRSAAMYLITYGGPAVVELSVRSGPFYREPPDGFTYTPLLSPRGELHLDDGDGSEVAATVAKGQGIEPITIDEALGLVPILKRDGLVSAAYDPAAQDIDVDLVCGGFRRGARANGVQIVCNAGVEALSRSGGTWRATTPVGEFEAPIIINAAGAWATPVARLAGANEIEVEPRRRSAAMLPAPGGHDVTNWPLFFGAGENWYARPTGGALMVSPAEAIAVPPQDIQIDKYDEILVEGLWRYEQRVTTPVTQVTNPWAGLRSFAPDGEPLAGFDTQAEGFFWLAGQGGYGFQTAPALSALAADLILGRADAADPVIDMVSPARFG